MTTDTDPRELPPLPTCQSRFDHAIGTPLFSADQMRAYALAALVAKVPSAPVEAVAWEWRIDGGNWIPCNESGAKHFAKQPGCEWRALGVIAPTPPQAEPSPGMSKSWQTAVAVAREAPSGRTVVDSAVILAIDKRLSEAFAELQEAKGESLSGKWYCEAHPEHEMDHDGCGGAGILGCARIGRFAHLLRMSRQETRETERMRDDLGAQLRATLAELQDVRKDVADWQPIETAPRGVTVLLWGPSFKRPHVGDWADYRVYNAPGYTRWAPLQVAPKP